MNSMNEARLRMADAPEGSELIYSSTTEWPVLVTENVFILPGVPKVFRTKFTGIRERFRALPYHTLAVFTREDEFDLAPRLNHVASMNPNVAIGSYPNFDEGDYRVKITVEGTEADAVATARALLIKLLDPAAVVRTE